MSILNELVLPQIQNFGVVETVDEFLSKFNLFDVSNDQLVQSASDIIAPQMNTLAVGGIGAIWNVPGNPDIVLKTSRPCKPSPFNFFKKECINIRNGSLIFRIPDTLAKKTKILCPNYISENLIGVLLYNLLSSYTPSIPKIFNFAVDSRQPSQAEINMVNNQPNPDIRQIMQEKLPPLVYTSMPRYNGIIDQITNLRQFIYMQFQVCQFLNVAQELTKFVHYDLHSGNIMSERPENVGDMFLNCYELDNGKFLYTYFPFSTLVIDYGYARMETPEHIISPKTDLQPGVWMDNFEYNPYTDLVEFLYDSIGKALRAVDSATNRPFGQLPNFDGRNQINMTNYMRLLFVSLFNLPVNSTDDDITTTIMNKRNRDQWFRFWNEKLADGNVRISKPSEMLSKIAFFIGDNLVPNMPRLTEWNTILQFLINANFYISDYYIKIPENLQAGANRLVSRFFPKVSLQDKENLTFLNYRTLIDNSVQGLNNLSSFDGIRVQHLNHINAGYFRDNILIGTTNTLPLSMTDPNLIVHSTFLDQQITLVSFNQDNVLERGYNFRFDCCRLDPRNYFQNNKFKSGVCMNSTFFEIYGNYTPTGYSNIGGINFTNKIPTNFLPYFGYVAISPNNNKLLIGFPYEESNLYPDNVITVGPMLVYQSNIVMTDDMLQNVSDINGHFLFKSRLPQNQQEAVLDTFADNVHNATRIYPGELYHAANPNPRSALVIRENGDVVMVKVEGRDRRGVGMDLAQLAQFCRNYLTARFAINLDGGGSSQITWKMFNQNYINIAGGQSATHSYLVGSILSLVKDK